MQSRRCGVATKVTGHINRRHNSPHRLRPLRPVKGLRLLLFPTMPTNGTSSEPNSLAIQAASNGVAVAQVRLHPCLQVPELVDMIFRWLGRDPIYGPRTLSSLARTCRWFLEPALDVLWSNLPSVGPLMCVLPADAWSIEKNTPPARNTVVRHSLCHYLCSCRRYNRPLAASEITRGS